MKTTKKVIFALLLIAAASCNTTKSDNFDWGYVIEGNYENKFFGIDWPIPGDWSYDDTYAQQWTKATMPDMQRLAESSYETKMRIKMPPQEIKNSTVFQLSKFEPGVELNPVIIVYADNLAAIEGAEVKDMEDYMAETVKEFNANPQMTLDSENYETERVGGTKFYKLNGAVKQGDIIRLQRYYATEINGFGLTFILSAPDKAGLEELEEVFRTVSL